MIKMEKNSKLIQEVKMQIKSDIQEVLKQPGSSSTRFNVDVDPD